MDMMFNTEMIVKDMKGGKEDMTENKRYSFNWERGHPNFWDNHRDLADCYMTCADVVDRLNELYDENQELKQELHKIYELATVNKVRDIVENVYDDLLYKTSDESDYARTKVLKCLEDIDNLRDDLE